MKTNDNVIFVFVNDYPFGFGEPFFEGELKILSQHFNKIHLMITEIFKTQGKKPLFYLPDNVSVHYIKVSTGLPSKISSLRFLFSSLFLQEWKIIKIVLHKRRSLKVISTMLISLHHAKRYSGEIQSLLSQYGYNLSSCYLYTYWMTDSTLSLALLKNMHPEIRCFTRLHRWDLIFEHSQIGYLPYRRYISDMIDGLFFISQHGKDYFKGKIPGVMPEKMHVCRLGVDPVIRTVHVKFDQNRYNILSISSIIGLKRLDLIVRALSLINDINIHWDHIGDGPDRQIIIEKCELLLSEKKNISYSFHGQISRNKIDQILTDTAYHLFVNTSVHEGIPVSIMEAMAYGIPVIAPEVGGIPEIVTVFNGILISQDPTPEEISDAIISIIRMKDIDYLRMRESAQSMQLNSYNSEKNYSEFVHMLNQEQV